MPIVARSFVTAASRSQTPILRGRSNPESHVREEYATMLPMAVFWRPSSLGRIELGNTETVGPAAQFRSDHQIRNVKCDSIDEGRVIGAGVACAIGAHHHRLVTARKVAVDGVRAGRGLPWRPGRHGRRWRPKLTGRLHWWPRLHRRCWLCWRRGWGVAPGCSNGLRGSTAEQRENHHVAAHGHAPSHRCGGHGTEPGLNDAATAWRPPTRARNASAHT